MNGAGDVPREGLTLNVDCDAAIVKSDVTPEEEHARVCAVVPGVAQDEASTPAQGVGVVGGEAKTQDVEHDLGRDRHAGGARTFSVAINSFQVALKSDDTTALVRRWNCILDRCT
jgi:hypothetical protein